MLRLPGGERHDDAFQPGRRSAVDHGLVRGATGGRVDAQARQAAARALPARSVRGDATLPERHGVQLVAIA